MKNDILNKMKDTEKSIKDSLRKDVKCSEESIRKDIEDIKKDVSEPKDDIEDLKNRMVAVKGKNHTDKKSYGEVIISEPQNHDEDKEVENIIKLV